MNGAIVLAAGKGTRFNGEKQFLQFKEKPVWRHVYDKVTALLPSENIIVVGVDIKGGDSRSESVMCGLNALNNETERVIILEAARPLVTSTQISILLEDKHPSSSFVMPLVNTVIRRDGSYLNREELYDLLTPQAFSYRLLKDAYDTGKYENMTDETRVMFEQYGIKPNLIETGQNLVKITYKRDIPILEKLYDLMERKEI